MDDKTMMLATHLAAKVFAVGTSDLRSADRIAFMYKGAIRGQEDIGCGLCESALADVLCKAIESAPVEPEPLRKEFVLVTQGRDYEIDAIGIIIEAMGSLQGYEIARILDYLQKRYTRPE